MWRLWSGALTVVALGGCGSDETLSPPEPATTTSNPSQTTDAPVPGDAGLINLCGAFWGLLQAPGMAERMCALQVTDPNDDTAISQCKLCASGLEFAERLLPEPECYSAVEDCPVSDAELTGCFEVVGEVLTEFVPNCDLDNLEPIDTTQLGIRIATSSCGPVLLVCQPLQELVAGLLAAQ